MNNCKNCANALFDKLWGDYKCKLDGLFRYDLSELLGPAENCPDHKEGEPGISKGIETTS